MKILYDISVLGGGMSDIAARTGIYRVVETVAEQLVLRKDCQVQFCSIENSLVQKYSLEYLQQKKEFSEIAFSRPTSFLGVEATTRRFELIDQVLKTKMPVAKRISTKLQIRSLWMKEKVYNLLSKDNVVINPRDLANADIFHSNFSPIPNQVRKAGKKSVFLTSYDLIPVLYPHFSIEGIRKTLNDILESINRDTWVLCISNATRNDLLNYKGNAVDPSKVLVTELAASDKFYQSTDKELNRQVRKLYGIPEAPYILSLCTLEPRKNIDQAIKAFAKIVQQERIGNLNLVLVGAKGWMFDKIFEEIEASTEVRDRIIITGYVANEHLAPLYTDALLFVYPTFYEGFGLPPLEAMQCGTPVITSNTSSLPEVVGNAGIMVSPTDLDALCNAMLSIYKNPSLREQMIKCSLERAKHFSWERCVQQTVNAYKASLV